MWRRKRENVRTITAAARERLIKWHLAQWASARRSWWRRERMGFDSRERNGRRDVRAALAEMHGRRGGTSTQPPPPFYFFTCIVCQEGRWHSTSDRVISASVASQRWKEEREGGGQGLQKWLKRRDGIGRGRGIVAREFFPRHPEAFQRFGIHDSYKLHAMLSLFRPRNWYVLHYSGPFCTALCCSETTVCLRVFVELILGGPIPFSI